jgi:hypothetical protein
VKQWATAHQVAQAADATVEAPTPLRPFEGACLSARRGDGAQQLFPFDSAHRVVELLTGRLVS